MPKTQDTYNFYPDHVIVKSRSGNTYLIAHNNISNNIECNCLGYSYRQHCRHIQYVVDNIHLWSERIVHPVIEQQPNVIQDSIMHQLIRGNKQ